MWASEEIFDLPTEYANCLNSELVEVSAEVFARKHEHAYVLITQACLQSSCFSILATGASVLHIKRGNYRLNEEMTGYKLRRRGN